VRVSRLTRVAAALLVVAGASPLRAQSNGASPTARQLALADSITRLTEQETGGFERAILATFGAPGQGDAGARMAAAMRRFLDKYFPADTLRALAIGELVATYTEPELAQLLGFHRTDVGRKMLKQSAATTSRVQQHVSRIMTEHRDELMQWLVEGMGVP